MISIKSNESECQNQSSSCYKEVHCQGTGLNGLVEIRLNPLIPEKKDAFLKMIYMRNVFRGMKNTFVIVLVGSNNKTGNFKIDLT